MGRRFLWLAAVALVGCGTESELLCQFERPSVFRIAHGDGSFSEGPFDCAYQNLVVREDGGVELEVEFSAVTSHAELDLVVRAPNRTWSVTDGALGDEVSLRIEDGRFGPDRLDDRSSTSGSITLDVERWPVEQGERGRIVADIQGTFDDDSTVEAALRFELFVVPRTLRTGDLID